MILKIKILSNFNEKESPELERLVFLETLHGQYNFQCYVLHYPN